MIGRDTCCFLTNDIFDALKWPHPLRALGRVCMGTMFSWVSKVTMESEESKRSQNCHKHNPFTKSSSVTVHSHTWFVKYMIDRYGSPTNTKCIYYYNRHINITTTSREVPPRCRLKDERYIRIYFLQEKMSTHTSCFRLTIVKGLLYPTKVTLLSSYLTLSCSSNCLSSSHFGAYNFSVGNPPKGPKTAFMDDKGCLISIFASLGWGTLDALNRLGTKKLMEYPLAAGTGLMRTGAVISTFTFGIFSPDM